MNTRFANCCVNSSRNKLSSDTDGHDNNMILCVDAHEEMHQKCMANESNIKQDTCGVVNDFTALLPREICYRIFGLLDIYALNACSMVKKSWYSFTRDPWLYKRLLLLAPWSSFASSQSTSSCSSKCYICLSKEAESFSKNGFPTHLTDSHLYDCAVEWYGEYKRQFQIHMNWLRDRYKLRIFNGHTSVVYCVVFDNERIITGSADSTIKVWNLHTNAQWSVQTLLGHSEAVRCLQLLHCPCSSSIKRISSNGPIRNGLYSGQKCPPDIQLISGSNDKTIKIWALAARNDWSSIVCRATLIGHTNNVRCLQADHNKIVSGSYDCTLKIWCLNTFKLLTTLRGHQDSILCVQYDDNVIVSGSLDKTIKLWTFSGNCLATLSGHSDSVACLHLAYKNNRIISGSHDNTLRVWDITNRKCVQIIDWIESEGHRRVIRCLQADHYRFVSGSDDKTIKVWSIQDGRRLHTYQRHVDGVSCLQFNNEMLVSGSYDHSVILWDFSVC